MTNEEKELLVAYLIDAGEIDGDSVDIEDQFLDWYHAREQTVSGESYYKALLEAGRIRKRAFQIAGAVRWVEGDPEPGGPPDVLALGQEQGVCDHGAPCGCYAEGYAAGMSNARDNRQGAPLEVIARLRYVLDRFEEGSEQPQGLRSRPARGVMHP